MVEEKVGKVEPNIGYGAPRGWKARQAKARLKMSHGANETERQKIRRIRKRHREELEGIHSPSQPSEATNAQEPVPTPEAEGSEPVKTERDELVKRLVDAGQKKPHPNTKVETLRKKVEELDGSDD